jgi:acetylornithine deacetylase
MHDGDAGVGPVVIERALTHLGSLVGCDTRNPPRAITPEHNVFRFAGDVLRACGFDVSVADLGDGSVNLLAIRGRPATLINCHLDTVPDAQGWSADPFHLRVEADRAIGLGACDTKGGGACLLAAAEVTDGPIAILLSSDEEAGPGRCVRAYLENPIDSVETVIVTEPTNCHAVTEHRGLTSGEIEFKGVSGHVATGRQRTASAVHQAVEWSSQALSMFNGGSSVTDDHRFNIGVIQGGTKPNMVASSATLQFGLRPPANTPQNVSLDALRALLPKADGAQWRLRFQAPALRHHERAAALARSFDISPAGAVDYWTEAALFAASGHPTFVYGPGSIEQAHSADEFVPLADLQSACDTYSRILSNR